MTAMIDPSLLSRLDDPDLLPPAGFVGGEWIADGSSEATFEVNNPSTGAVIARLPEMTAQETRRAIDAAWSAQKEWASRSARERAAVLKRSHEMMLFKAGAPMRRDHGEVLRAAL